MTSHDQTAVDQPPDPPEPRSGGWLMIGIVSVAAALAASELMAGLFDGVPSLVEGMGDWVIDNVPTPVKNWAISTLGTADKPILVASTVVVALSLGAITGVRARSRFSIVIGVFALIGLLATWATSVGSAVSLGPALVGAAVAVVVGVVCYHLLRLLPAAAAPTDRDRSARRRVLTGAGAALGLSVLGAGLGRFLLGRSVEATQGREDAGRGVNTATAPPSTLPDPAPDTSLEVDGLTPLFVPNEDFYRIDTALSVPRVDVAEWSLRVTGMVDNELELSFDDLISRPLVEADVTLSCVSNEVGGGLVGNARWLGVPLEMILDEARVSDGAEQIVGRSVDDFTVGFPLENARDGRTALVAVEMNDEPLPFEHGFPARLVVAGLYGYVSATKWLSEIELTTWDGFDAYWVPRGWSKEGPVKTQSRIDVPGDETITPGMTPVAGVAWAPNRGVSVVEVQIDDQPWAEAELAESVSDDSWRQWVYRWEATPGEHQIRVRATDGDGVTQTEERTPVAPDGASGWHTISVRVA